MKVLTIEVSNELGPIGLGYAADILEDSADVHRSTSVMHAESIQFAADFLRQIAAVLTRAAQESGT